jgi:hypothetical protein
MAALSSAAMPRTSRSQVPLRRASILICPISRQLAGILRAAIEAGEIPRGRPVPSKRYLTGE